MEEFKGTKWSVEERFDEERMQNVFEIDNDFEEGAVTVWTSLDEKKSLQRANLICEAFNVVTRTGLTPEQMEKEMQSLKSDCEINSESFRNQLKESNIELAKMEARLKEAVAVISKVNDWLYKGDESEYSNESLMDLTDEYLTKEKTK